MGASERRKGADGEREFFQQLNDWLGHNFVRRNLEQSRSGGSDSIGSGPFSIEVKRQEAPRIGQWWRQTEMQAGKLGKIPVLAFRQNRGEWRVLVGMNVADFAEYAREAIFAADTGHH